MVSAQTKAHFNSFRQFVAANGGFSEGALVNRRRFSNSEAATKFVDRELVHSFCKHAIHSLAKKNNFNALWSFAC